MKDFLRLYNLEAYLFSEVTKRFREEGTLSAFDFFCIIIWKANRAKSKVAARLNKKGHSTLEEAVAALLNEIGKASDNRGRLEVLISQWRFRLPMATAILTVLYPEDFTIYDVRVCNVLKNFKDLQYKTNFEVLWKRYMEYVEAVLSAGPAQLELREKDRYLWGKSFAEQLERDVEAGFEKADEIEELDA